MAEQDKPIKPDPQRRTTVKPLVANLLHFVDVLRRSGVSVSLEQSLEAPQALALIDIGKRDHVYYALRGLLINRKEDLKLYDQLFEMFWSVPTPRQGRGQKAPVAPRHNVPERKRLTIATLLAEKARQSDPQLDIADKAGSYSATELLRQKEFSHMTAEELATVKRLIQTMRWRASLRQTRRQVPDRNGNRLNLRQVMRSCAKYDGVPLGLAWKRHKIKPRPVIVLADISGSMEKYSRLLLQFSYSMTRGLYDVETFVFGTRLSRITSQLRVKNIDRAINEASRAVVDWSGGTRIGECLHAFNRNWSRRVLRRGAVVLVISDGWERGDVSILRREMRYLQHRCHRLVWLNPLLGSATYRPLVEGMSAALPFIDDFLPIHNLQSLETLAWHLETLGYQRSARPTIARPSNY